MKIKVLLFLLLCINHAQADETSKEQSKFSFGIIGAFNYSIHTSDFYDLPPMNSYAEYDKVKFTNGTGVNPAFGLLVGYHFNDEFSTELTLKYQSISVEMNTKAPIGLQEYNGQPIQLYSEKSLKPEINALALSPKFCYSPKLFENFSFAFGPEINMLTNGTFSYKETLSGEDGYESYLFLNENSTSRDELPSNTEINGLASLSIGLNLEAAYAIRLSEQFSFTPRLSFSLGFTDLVKDISWKYNAISFGFSVSYRGIESEKTTTPIEVDEKPVITNTKKKCQEGFILNKDNECIPMVPTLIDQCRGSYLAFASFKSQDEANSELQLLTKIGITQLKVELLRDAVNPSNSFYTVVTSCYESIEDALSAKRIINQILNKNGIKRIVEIRER